MKIKLKKAKRDDAQKLVEMQIESFVPLYRKYRDNEIVGAIRIRELDNKRYRISPIFILPRFHGKGIAKEVFRLIEEIYYDAKVWELDTILQEVGNCHLYEKLGYRRTGREEIINEKMTIIFYEKR